MLNELPLYKLVAEDFDKKEKLAQKQAYMDKEFKVLEEQKKDAGRMLSEEDR